jgi:hypothetical protein
MLLLCFLKLAERGDKSGKRYKPTVHLAQTVGASVTRKLRRNVQGWGVWRAPREDSIQQERYGWSHIFCVPLPSFLNLGMMPLRVQMQYAC